MRLARIRSTNASATLVREHWDAGHLADHIGGRRPANILLANVLQGNYADHAISSSIWISSLFIWASLV